MGTFVCLMKEHLGEIRGKTARAFRFENFEMNVPNFQTLVAWIKLLSGDDDVDLCDPSEQQHDEEFLVKLRLWGKDFLDVRSLQLPLGDFYRWDQGEHTSFTMINPCVKGKSKHPLTITANYRQVNSYVLVDGEKVNERRDWRFFLRVEIRGIATRKSSNGAIKTYAGAN